MNTVKEKFLQFYYFFYIEIFTIFPYHEIYMNILTWIVFGLIAGLLANYIYPEHSKGGLLSAIVLGIAGAVIGGFIGASLFGVGVSGFNLTSLIVSVGGALLLLTLARHFRRV